MKNRVIEVKFGFSEYGHEVDGKSFSGANALSDANLLLQSKTLRWKSENKLGYAKTDFKLTFDDGETYEGRYDIGADARTLEKHIENFIKYIINSPDYLQETKDYYNKFWATYFN